MIESGDRRDKNGDRTPNQAADSMITVDVREEYERHGEPHRRAGDGRQAAWKNGQ